MAVLSAGSMGALQLVGSKHGARSWHSRTVLQGLVRRRPDQTRAELHACGTLAKHLVHNTLQVA